MKHAAHRAPCAVGLDGPFCVNEDCPNAVRPIHSPGVHLRFPDDGVDYCGWRGDGGIYDGCGQVWPCSAVRGGAMADDETGD